MIYQVVDLEMYKIKPKDWADQLQVRLATARRALRMPPAHHQWELAHMIQDCGTFWAVFEARPS